MKDRYNDGEDREYNEAYDREYDEEYDEEYDREYDENEDYYDENEGYEDEQYDTEDGQYPAGDGKGVDGKKKRKKTVKIVAAVLAALIVLIGGILIYGAVSLKTYKDNPMAAFEKVEPTNQIIQQEEAPSVSKDYNDRLVVFTLIGLDSSEERDKKNRGWRSDTMVVCVVDTQAKAVSMITVPRDTKTEVNKIGNDGNITSTITAKLNSAFTYGGGPQKYGYSNAAYAISKVLFLKELGIPEIKLAVGMNMDGISKLADALDGVPVVLEADYPGYGKKGDVITVSGKEAETFVRTRKGKGLNGSDIDRTKHQQWFLKSAAKKIKEMGPVAAAPKLLTQMSGIMQTNMDTKQITSLALVLEAMNMNTIKNYTLPGKDVHESGAWYYIMDEQATKDMVKEIFYQNEAQ